MITGRLSHQLHTPNGNGRRYIGVVVTYILILIFVFQFYLNIDRNYILNYSYYFLTPRIFLTRFASWLCNDIVGKTNSINLRPYNVGLYESFYEGLYPLIFLFTTKYFLSYKTQNLIVCISYSISRFILEFLKNNNLKNSNLNLGHIDSILNFVFIYWYIISEYNFYDNIIEYILLLIFYYDVCIRFTNNILNKNYNFMNIEFIWKYSYNPGFYNGSKKDMNSILKFFYPSVLLFLINRFLLYDCKYTYFFNCCALLNIFERTINGHVTDYLSIKFSNYKTNNFNYSDVIINIFILWGILSNLTPIIKNYIY